MRVNHNDNFFEWLRMPCLDESTDEPIYKQMNTPRLGIEEILMHMNHWPINDPGVVDIIKNVKRQRKLIYGSKCYEWCTGSRPPQPSYIRRIFSSRKINR